MPSAADRGLRGRSPRLTVLMVASEVAPWAKTGGLADVVGALPGSARRARSRRDRRHAPISNGRCSPTGVARFQAACRSGRAARDVTLHIVELSARRAGGLPRLPAVLRPRRDLRQRRPRLRGQRRALRAARRRRARCRGEDETRPPSDVIHAHDWQAGLVPTLASPRSRARWPALAGAGLVLTIHNLAYQGLFPRDVVPALGLPWDCSRWTRGVLGTVQLSEGRHHRRGLRRRPSVRPTRDETLTPQFGAGLEGVLARARRPVCRHPERHRHRRLEPGDRPVPAGALRRAGSVRQGRRASARCSQRFGLPHGDDALARPLIGLVSRLVEQKGLDLIEAASADARRHSTPPGCSSARAKPRYETFLQRARRAHPSRVGVHIGFDERLAHLVEAGADMFLMPSEFEPCGLNQMYSLRYGTVPIVHAVGGLRRHDSAATRRGRSARTGSSSSEPTPDELGARRAAGRAAVSRSAGVAAADAQRHGGRSLLAAVGQGICQSVQTGSARRRRRAARAPGA